MRTAGIRDLDISMDYFLLFDSMLTAHLKQENQFKYIDKPATANSSANLTNLETATVKYVFPPYSTTTQNRHSVYNANLR